MVHIFLMAAPPPPTSREPPPPLRFLQPRFRSVAGRLLPGSSPMAAVHSDPIPIRQPRARDRRGPVALSGSPLRTPCVRRRARAEPPGLLLLLVPAAAVLPVHPLLRSAPPLPASPTRLRAPVLAGCGLSPS